MIAYDPRYDSTIGPHCPRCWSSFYDCTCNPGWTYYVLLEVGKTEEKDEPPPWVPHPDIGMWRWWEAARPIERTFARQSNCIVPAINRRSFSRGQTRRRFHPAMIRRANAMLKQTTPPSQEK